MLTTRRAPDDFLGATRPAATLSVGSVVAIAVENGPFLGAVRVTDDDLEHEAVDLRFGQRIGAFLLERVLRGHDEERIGQFVGRLRRA